MNFKEKILLETYEEIIQKKKDKKPEIDKK
jgi:hypothetical protein